MELVGKFHDTGEEREEGSLPWCFGLQTTSLTHFPLPSPLPIIGIICDFPWIGEALSVVENKTRFGGVEQYASVS